MIKIILIIISFLILTTVEIMAQINPEAEKYISKMLSKEIPYQVTVLEYDFVINNINTYPPGQLTAMFAQYLIDNDLVKNKVVADIGCGCFALGIIAAKSGADTIIGTDINKYAIQCASDNLELHKIEQRTYLFREEGVKLLLPKFTGKIDIIVAGVPWDSISLGEFEKIDDNRKLFSRSFYDIDDELITAIMTEGFDLLTPEGKIFITSSMRTLERIKHLCLKHNISYKIVKEADLHNDGNIHYIVELISN
jgi:release factor glutamine methyltransferase